MVFIGIKTAAKNKIKEWRRGKYDTKQRIELFPIIDAKNVQCAV
jgi:hypothetical protein